MSEASPNREVRIEQGQPRRPAVNLSMTLARRWHALKEDIQILRATRSTARLIRRDIGLSGVRDIQGLIDTIAERRNRPISVNFAPLPPEVSGFCARGKERDVVVVDSGASELTRLHVILHELGHLWEDDPSHDSEHPIDEEFVRELLPGLNPGTVLRVLARSHYDTKHERRAEAFATVMVQQHLQLDRRQDENGSMLSALAHRRTGV
ncbi:hypothetical protein GCM10020000_86610 [Streptomyces olivoverticillatus]